MKNLSAVDENKDIATKEYVDTGLGGKQPTLVSGSNIKTINNESILGEGNLNIKEPLYLNASIDSINNEYKLLNVSWETGTILDNYNTIKPLFEANQQVYLRVTDNTEDLAGLSIDLPMTFRVEDEDEDEDNKGEYLFFFSGLVQALNSTISLIVSKTRFIGIFSEIPDTILSPDNFIGTDIPNEYNKVLEINNSGEISTDDKYNFSKKYYHEETDTYYDFYGVSTVDGCTVDMGFAVKDVIFAAKFLIDLSIEAWDQQAEGVIPAIHSMTIPSEVRLKDYMILFFPNLGTIKLNFASQESGMTVSTAEFTNFAQGYSIIVGDQNTPIQIIYAAMNKDNYLAKDNTAQFTPTGDYNPATKKYVDDNTGTPEVEISETTPTDPGIELWVDESEEGGDGETDPVFTASPAHSITSTDINNWNGKQNAISDLDEIREGAEAGATAIQKIKTVNNQSLIGEGNINIQGGIEEESDPVFTASAAHNITSTDISNWNNKQNTISDLETIRSGAALGATAIQSVKTINNSSILGSGNLNISVSDEQINDDVVDFLSANPLVEPSDRGIGEIVTGWSNPTERKFITTNVTVGTLVNIDNPTVSSGTNWRYTVIPFSAGDVLIYRGRGGSSGRAWAFLDSDNKLIEQADSFGSNLVGKVIVAPSRTAKLVINDQSGDPSYNDAVDMYIVRASAVPAKIQPLSFSDPADMTFVPTASEPINLSARTKSTSANWKYSIVYCKEGDTFLVSGWGGGSARLWCFVGKNGEQLAVSDSSVQANNLKLVAPVGTYALVINTQDDASSYQIYEKVEKEVLFYSGKKQQYKSGKIFFTVDVHDETCNNFDISSTSLTPDTNPYSTSTKEVNAMLMLPSSYSITGKPTKVIMIAHGASGYVTPGHNPEWYPGDADNMRPTIDYLLNKGYAVFDVDKITGQSDFGCPALVEAYKKAFEYIKFNYNVEEQLIIYGMSRGTWTSMTYTQRYRQDVRCMVICGPEESYDWAWNSASGLNRATFAANFGFSNTSGSVYEADKMKPYDLYANIVSLNSTNYLFKNFPPMKWLFGGLDEVGGTCDTRSRAVATALRNAGNFVIARTVNNYTHSDICHLSSVGLKEEFLTFINKYE